ncbi:Hypothetical predicted protein, partial [Marmota monax]
MACPAAPWLLLVMPLALLGSLVAPAFQPVSTTGVGTLGRSAEVTKGAWVVRDSK